MSKVPKLFNRNSFSCRAIIVLKKSDESHFVKISLYCAQWFVNFSCHGTFCTAGFNVCSIAIMIRIKQVKKKLNSLKHECLLFFYI